MEKKDYVLDVPKREIQNVSNVILDNELKERISILYDLGKTCFVYAMDNDDCYPKKLEAIKPYLNEKFKNIDLSSYSIQVKGKAFITANSEITIMIKETAPDKNGMLIVAYRKSQALVV